MLTAIDQNGPASQAGLLSHDLVVRLDGEPVTGIDDMIRLLDRNRIGKRVSVDVLRLGRLRSFDDDADRAGALAGQRGFPPFRVAFFSDNCSGTRSCAATDPIEFCARSDVGVAYGLGKLQPGQQFDLGHG